MFTAYFDESGSDDTSALVVAGFVSTAEQWLRFDQDWKEILDRHGVSFFHMTDYAHSRGEFESWKGQEEKRNWFMQCLTNIIRVRAVASFGSILVLRDYQTMDARFMLHEEFGNPYPLCASCSVSAVFHWAKKNHHPEPIRFVFEDGVKYKGDLLARMEKEGIPLPTFGSKKEFPPLQAADLLAWEHLKAFRQRQAGTLPQFRKSLAALLGGLPNYSGIYGAEGLERFCNQLPVALRSSFPTPDPSC